MAGTRRSPLITSGGGIAALIFAVTALACPAIAHAQEDHGGGHAGGEPLNRLEVLTGISHAATLGSTVLLAGLAAFAVFVATGFLTTLPPADAMVP